MFLTGVPWLNTGLILGLCLLLPGYILGGWLWDWRTWPWISRWPVAFVLAVGVFNLLAVVSQMLGYSLQTGLWLGLGLILILVLFRLFRPVRSTTADAVISGAGESLGQGLVLLVTTILFVGVAVLFWQTASSASFEDDRFYLAFIRHYQEEDLSPTFWPVVHESGQGSPATVARATLNGWWIVLAGLNELSGVALPDWYARFFLFYLVMLALAAAYTFTFTISHNHRAALFTIALQLLIALTSLNSHEWLGRAFFDRLIEDKFLVVLVILPVANSFLYRFLVQKEWRIWPALILAGLALVLTHPLGLGQWVVSGVGLVGLTVWPRLTQARIAPRWRRSWFWLTGLLLLLLVLFGQWVWLRANVSTGLAANATQVVQDRTRLVVLSQSWGLYLAHPHLIAHPLTLLALGLVVWWWRQRRGNAAAIFLLTATFIPILLIYNPLTASLLGAVITPTLLYRLAWVIPVAPILALGLDGLPERFFPRSRLRPHHFLVLSLVLLTLPLVGYFYDGLALLRAQKQADMPLSQIELLDELARIVGPEELVVAPDEFNDAIPTWTSRARLLRFHLDDGPYLNRPDRAQFYAQPWVVASTLEQLAEWQARFIILLPEHPLAEQMAGLPELFALRFANEAGQVWQWQGAAAATPALVRANTHLSQGQWAEAATIYHQIIAVTPAAALAHLGLGICQWVQGDSAAASQSWQQTLMYNPTSLSARLWLLTLAQEMGNDAAANQHLTIATREHPQAKWLHQVWGEMWLQAGSAAAAESQFALAVTSPAGTGAYYLELGQLYQTYGLNEAAITAYQQVLTLDDNPLSALTGRPLLPLWFANPRQNPQAWRVVQAYEGLAQIWSGQGELALAETAYREIITLAPYEPMGVAPLAQQFLEQGDPGEALRLYRQAIWRNPFLAWSHQQVGGLLLRVAETRPRLAEFHLRWASELDTENVWVYRQLAQSYHQQGESERALALYQQVVADHPWWVDGYAGLGREYAAAHRLDEAEAVYQDIVARLAVVAAAYPPLAEFYAQAGQGDRLMTLYEGAVAAAPTQSWPYVSLATAYQNNHQPALALAALQEAIAQDPGNITLYHQLADLYRQQNNPDQARSLDYLSMGLHKYIPGTH